MFKNVEGDFRTKKGKEKMIKEKKKEKRMDFRITGFL